LAAIKKKRKGVNRVGLQGLLKKKAVLEKANTVPYSIIFCEMVWWVLQ